ncbi:DUF3990 domain-containing protein [Radiobacillus sp. PE A8.2]|uniref:DUF3990 domain-containing protein n=1 Tax=Radiobacillus sp. PE A8.2 TaxID=3380349 RepID=UPI003890ABD2
MNYTYPTSDVNLKIPNVVIHGTTNIGAKLIKNHGILERGFNPLGYQKKPSSLDFGEGFYCTYNNIATCVQQVNKLSETRAKNYSAKPVILNIEVDQLINSDTSLRCVYFDGKNDGLDWAKFIVHHRVNKDKRYCFKEPCEKHPDIMIGPVADRKYITALAHGVKSHSELIYFYKEIKKAPWFPQYKQIVFSGRVLKYLRPCFNKPYSGI